MEMAFQSPWILLIFNIITAKRIFHNFSSRNTAKSNLRQSDKTIQPKHPSKAGNGVSPGPLRTNVAPPFALGGGVRVSLLSFMFSLLLQSPPPQTKLFHFSLKNSKFSCIMRQWKEKLACVYILLMLHWWRTFNCTTREF